MLSGKDVFKTRDFKQAGIPSAWLSDGPHGLREQAGPSDHLDLNSSEKAILHQKYRNLRRVRNCTALHFKPWERGTCTCCWESEGGAYTVYVGSNSEDHPLSAMVKIEG